MIGIEILYGNSSVGQDDRDRAVAAAERALGNTDPAAAYAEYRAQWDAADSEDHMTGLAALWVSARQAADVALTAGWHDPNGAACSIYA